MSLSDKQIQNIAHLARLALAPGEAERHATSLSNILGLVGQLEQADTAGVEPMAHPLEDQVQRLRADVVTSTNQRELFQQNAPQVEAGQYLVPRVIE